MTCLKNALKLLPGIGRAFSEGFEKIEDWQRLSKYFNPSKIEKTVLPYSSSEKMIIAAMLTRAKYESQSLEIWERGFNGFYNLSPELQEVLVQIFTEGKSPTF